jgi:hypothetical protein
MKLNPTSSVEVVKADHTITTFARCTCDVFTADTLTVTSIDDGRVVGLYGPGTWREGRAYGVDGWPAFGFASRMECERRRTA